MPDSFTCDDCGRTSRHPQDIAHSYCYFCHEFKNDPRPLNRPQLDLLRALRSDDPAGNARQVVFQRQVVRNPVVAILEDLHQVVRYASLRPSLLTVVHDLQEELLFHDDGGSTR